MSAKSPRVPPPAPRCPLPKRFLFLFATSRRKPAITPLLAKPIALSTVEAATRNYARMHRAAMARERRFIDGR